MNSSVIEYRGEVFTKTTYNDISVIVDSDGYYNASKICTDNDTQYAYIARNQYWTSYIDKLQCLCSSAEAPEEPLFRDRTLLMNELRGVYIHKDLVNYLCIHVNLDYAIKVGEIMDLINEKTHQENTTLQDEIKTLNEEVDRLKVNNDALHEDNKNLTNNVNELRTRAVPKNTNNKLLRIMKRDGELYKISANSYWPDKQFEDQGYTMVTGYLCRLCSRSLAPLRSLLEFKNKLIV